jgi:hypothetical protein
VPSQGSHEPERAREGKPEEQERDPESERVDAEKQRSPGGMAATGREGEDRRERRSDAGRSGVRRFWSSAPPNQAAPAPSATKIAPNPATNAAVVVTTRRGRAPSSSKPTPETNER